MANKNTEKIIIGTLMKEPLLLSQTDKYNLTVDDFDEKLHKHIFYAIACIAQDGSTLIKVQDVDLFLQDSSGMGSIFRSSNGVSLLNDAIELANEQSFSVYYSLLKKENLLRDLRKMGIDTSEFYEINPITQEQTRINEKYLNLDIQDIIEAVKLKILKVEKNYLSGEGAEGQNIFEGMEELLSDLDNNSEVGIPLCGDIFNTCVSGAKKGALYVRSGSSGLSKTRQAVADACFLAFPIRYSQGRRLWVQTGHNEKILIVVTEQSFKEIRLMILAYLTGLNEKKVKRKELRSTAEEYLLLQALKIVEAFKENLYIIRMPNPTIESLKVIVREYVLVHQIEYLFYDYIFIGPSLLNEFKGISLRNDEVLLMFATALKDLAVELNIFVMTSTQVNAKAEDNRDIRNESSIAGSRAVINKADVGCIMARPTPEELKQLSNVISDMGIREPNIVTDIYKNRGDEWTQVRIWTDFDAGTLRKKDLFITDSRLNTIQNFQIDHFSFVVPLEIIGDLLKELNRKEKQ